MLVWLRFRGTNNNVAKSFAALNFRCLIVSNVALVQMAIRGETNVVRNVCSTPFHMLPAA